MNNLINAPDVSTPHPQFAALEKKRELIRAIMGGTFEMRKLGQKYLPKHPAESDAVYSTRLNKTFLDNFTKLAIETATGKVFSNEPVLENIPTAIEDLFDNIDLQGSGLDEFMRTVGKQAFEDGISYVLIDTPKIDGVVTLADQKKLGLRPYAIHIKPCCVLEVLSEMVDGVETVTRVRLSECVSERVGEWGFVEIDQIRVLELVQDKTRAVKWSLYRKDEKGKWQLNDEGFTGFSRIYLVPFYTNRTAFMQGSTGFERIAETNLEHWQTKSEHAFSLSMCCFGMFTATGVADDFTFEIGAAKCQVSTNPDAKFSVLETSGTGVTLAADALKAIESRIETAGVNLRVENAGKVTATAAAIDSEETNAALNAVAESFGDSLETMIGYFAEIMGIDAPDISADLKLNSGIEAGSQAGLQELTKAVTAGVLSNESYINELKRRGELAEDFDVEANKEQLTAQGNLDMFNAPPIAPRSKTNSVEDNAA